MALIGLSVGVGAGVFLRPAHEKALAANPCGELSQKVEEGATANEGVATREYVKLNNQFVVPVVRVWRRFVTGYHVDSDLEVKLGNTRKGLFTRTEDPGCILASVIRSRKLWRVPRRVSPKLPIWINCDGPCSRPHKGLWAIAPQTCWSQILFARTWS